MPDPIAKHLEVLADALATPGEGLCPACRGAGTVDQIYDDAEVGEYVVEQQCPSCDGHGLKIGGSDD